MAHLPARLSKPPPVAAIIVTFIKVSGLDAAGIEAAAGCVVLDGIHVPRGQSRKRVLPIVAIVIAAKDAFARSYPEGIFRTDGQIVDIADEMWQARRVPMRAIVERNRHSAMTSGGN